MENVAKLGPLAKVAEKVVEEVVVPGSMGLKGWLAQLFNATAMVCLAAVMFINMADIRDLHTEGIRTLREILDVTVASQSKVIESNTAAIKDLANEVKALRRDRNMSKVD